MSDEKFAGLVTGLTIVGIVLCAAIMVSYTTYKSYELDNKAIEAGYIQDTLPGRAGVYWVKPNNHCKCMEKPDGT